MGQVRKFRRRAALKLARREAAWGGKKLNLDDRLCVKAYGRIFAFEWRRSNCR